MHGVLRSVLALVAAATVVAAPAHSVASSAPRPVARAAQVPTVTGLTPDTVSTLGNARVIVRGTGLRATRTVWLGTQKAKLLRVVSNHKVVVRTRLHRPGEHPVRVVTDSGTSPVSGAAELHFQKPDVVLDPGHNGRNAEHLRYINHQVPAGYGRTKPCNTTGTATNLGYPEHAFNWHVAENVRRQLKHNYVHVIMTRHNDHGVGPCVNKRAKIESTDGVEAAVAIHADGGPSSGHGFHVIEDSRRPVGASRATVRHSTELGTILHNTLLRESGLTKSNYFGHNGYVHSDIYAGLNLSTNPTSFLELGNMRNAGDAAEQHSSAGRKRIAGAIADGLLSYLRRTE